MKFSVIMNLSCFASHSHEKLLLMHYKMSQQFCLVFDIEP